MSTMTTKFDEHATEEARLWLVNDERAYRWALAEAKAAGNSLRLLASALRRGFYSFVSRTVPTRGVDWLSVAADIKEALQDEEGGA